MGDSANGSCDRFRKSDIEDLKSLIHEVAAQLTNRQKENRKGDDGENIAKKIGTLNIETLHNEKHVIFLFIVFVIKERRLLKESKRLFPVKKQPNTTLKTKKIIPC